MYSDKTHCEKCFVCYSNHPFLTKYSKNYLLLLTLDVAEEQEKTAHTLLYTKET